jgi:hypothetical protein
MALNRIFALLLKKERDTAMDSQWSYQSAQQWNPAFSRPSLLRHPLAWRRARRLERIHRSNDQRLAWRVQDVLMGCGLSQDDYSVGGGRVFHIPQVLSVSHGPPASLDMHMLQGQTPEDSAAHAPAISFVGPHGQADRCGARRHIAACAGASLRPACRCHSDNTAVV